MQKKERLVYIQWIMIFFLSILVSMLIVQNLHYKKKYSNVLTMSGLFSSKNLAYELKKNFWFKDFPISIDLKDYHFSDGYKKQNMDDIVVMVFDLSVCGRCLRDGLDVLGYYRNIAWQKNIFFLAIVGIDDKREESEIIELYKSGNLFFPVKIMKKSGLFDSLKIRNPDSVDTPIFFYISSESKVMDIFKPRYLKKEDLDKWINLILN